MACEQTSRRLTRLAGQVGAGITHLAHKRAFYAGVALGGLGLLSAGLVGWTRRQSRSRRPQSGQAPDQNQRPDSIQSIQNQRQGNPMPSIPNLSPRTKVKPALRLNSGERCGRCRSQVRHKPGAWYVLNGQRYCPDCAPNAARAAKVDLVLPDASGAAGNGASTANGVTQGDRPLTGRSRPPYLSPERRVRTRLAKSRLRLNAGHDPAGQPVWYVVEQGFVVLRANGLDTGLAITPALKIGALSHGVQEVTEDTGRWWITHIPSGKTLGQQPYADPETAHVLASVLAQVDWTRAEHEISDTEIGQIRETVRRFNQALAAEQPETKQEAAQTELTPPPEPESLLGKLVADGYGGVSRVLDVSPDGKLLFLIDNLGKRYELSRHEIRTPDDQDFEMCRVARSFDPTKKPEATCARCGQPARNPETGERWYRMGGQNFCRPCSTAYAAEEGYIKDEEINSDLEPMV